MLNLRLNQIQIHAINIDLGMGDVYAIRNSKYKLYVQNREDNDHCKRNFKKNNYTK